VSQWRADLAELLPDIATVHPDLADGVPASLTDEVERLSSRATTLNDDELMVGVMRLMTHVTTSGRDGHTGLFVWGDSNRSVHSLPLRWWTFSDGLYVEDQLGGSGLVGARVVGVGGHPLSDVFGRVDPLIPHDNASTIALLRPRFLLIPEVLHGVGLIDRVGPVPLDVITRSGHRETVRVQPIDISDYNSWAGSYGLHLVPRGGAAYLQHLDAVAWHRVLPDGHTLYVGYNQVELLDIDELRRITRLARSDDIDHVVIDIRHNFGGEVREAEPLLDLLTGGPVRSKQVSLLVGRNTFSAAVLFAAHLIDRRDVTVVGEPTGGSPTAYGNAADVQMPRTGLVVSVAGTRERALGPADHRTSIEPDVRVSLSFRDYAAGRDPVLQAALEHAR
jgi:hypothetical protein